MSRVFWSGWLLGAAAWVLSCSSDDKPAALGVDTGAGSSGTSSRSGSSSGAVGGQSAEEGGAPAVGGAAERPPIGDVGGDGLYQSDGGAPPNPATLCDRDAEWTTTAVPGLDTDADERLLAMTPDERTLVFSRDDELLVRDDEQLTPVTLPVGYTHSLGVSLTADGLSLIVVKDDGEEFAEVSRATRGTAFGALPSAARFEALNATRTTSGGSFSSPALSADGQTLYYTHRMGPSVANVWRARGPQLSELARQDSVTLGTEDGKAKLVVSVSADERTLFVLDEALGYVAGLWRVTPAAAFADAVGFEGFETVIPNQGCDRIYATTEVGGSLAVVTGSPN